MPTFRGEEGLWKNYRAEDLATPEAFARDPKLVWQWYDWRRGLINDIKPNPAHFALAELEKKFNNFEIVTQNVDGLHTLAGSTDVLTLHGDIWKVRCTECGTVTENRDVPIEILPYCKSINKGDCNGLIRPHIVWFGEMLEEEVIGRAFRIATECDIMFVIGTSGVVQPAASLAGIAKGNGKNGGAYVVEINMEETPLSPLCGATLLGKAGEIVPGFL